MRPRDPFKPPSQGDPTSMQEYPRQGVVACDADQVGQEDIARLARRGGELCQSMLGAELALRVKRVLLHPRGVVAPRHN